jgi:hypothetical protein
VRHHQHIDPVVRRHRRLFAVLRIAEVSLGVLGMMTFLLVLTAPSSPGSTTRELYFIAWSTPRLFAAASAVLVAAAGFFEAVSRPLNRKWSHDLRGWID